MLWLLVNIPKMNYIAVRGRGNPNEEKGEYQKYPYYRLPWGKL